MNSFSDVCHHEFGHTTEGNLFLEVRVNAWPRAREELMVYLSGADNGVLVVRCYLAAACGSLLVTYPGSS
jgi:hypothetical protein